MQMKSGVAALVGVLVAVCALVAWEWYTHVGPGRHTPQPVQQIAASTPAVSPTPTATASPAPVPTQSQSPAPVIYVPKASPAASPSTAPSAAPASTPAPAVTLTPYAASGHAISNEPMVTATLGPHAISVPAVREAPDAPPRILAMSISTPVAHGGDVVSGTVQTSSNVASVEARIAGYSSSMQKVGVGKFVMSYRVPKLPFFLHRTYTIEVIARNTRGDAVTSSVPITIR